jgi:type II secretory pathway pseudopilin PulG
MQTGGRMGGYTIIEVMIFLAVSGFMFILAAAFIQGKQSTTQFHDAMNSANSEIQEVINEVQDNNYLGTNLSCQTSDDSTPTFPPTGGTQGSNDGCVFLGKVLQFGVAGSNNQDYNIYTVAGCQYSNCDPSITDPLESASPSSFAQAEAKVVDPGTNNSCLATVSAANLTSCNRLEWGMAATAVYDDSNGTPVSTNSIGLFNSFIESNGQGLVSGTQDVEAVDTGFTGVSIGSNLNESDMVSIIDNGIDTAQTINNPYFVVCFNDGAGNVGALTIGGPDDAGSLNTSMQISHNSSIELFSNPNYKCST